MKHKSEKIPCKVFNHEFGDGGLGANFDLYKEWHELLAGTSIDPAGAIYRTSCEIAAFHLWMNRYFEPPGMPLRIFLGRPEKAPSGYEPSSVYKNGSEEYMLFASVEAVLESGEKIPVDTEGVIIVPDGEEINVVAKVSLSFGGKTLTKDDHSLLRHLIELEFRYKYEEQYLEAALSRLEP